MKQLRHTSLLVVFLAATAVSAQGVPAKLQHDRLLFYADETGAIRPVKNVADWAKRRAAILKAMQEVMGPLPVVGERTLLDMKVDDEVDCGSYVRRLISYVAEPGQRVPAYLLVPKALVDDKDKKAPAVLSLHP